ncbi:MAG: hypothetical protein JWS08_00785 [Phormidium sp. PBR-2020]|nr:MAG: hypothetical protein JWS08_00785 [Phormidium sp. PBR-2020]
MNEELLDGILTNYQNSFIDKVYAKENDEHDLLMDVFNLSPDLKRENRQYWGRELGMCWQLLVTEICKMNCDDFEPALKFGKDEPCDLVVGRYAIDTKYRMGSGDSGTLKKFKRYGVQLKKQGYTPILLILRADNLKSAIQACQKGGWQLHIGDDSLSFLQELTGFDLRNFLERKVGAYPVNR